MRNCINGANTNCPNEPPALMNPAATERLLAGRCRATPPMRMEKLPAPAPAAASSPMLAAKAHCERTLAVSAVPAASIKPPTTKTRPEP